MTPEHTKGSQKTTPEHTNNSDLLFVDIARTLCRCACRCKSCLAASCTCMLETVVMTHPRSSTATSTHAAGNTHTVRSAHSSKQQHALHVLPTAILLSSYSSESIAAASELQYFCDGQDPPFKAAAIKQACSGLTAAVLSSPSAAPSRLYSSW